eukprot:CAMPEP_0170465400 /NCGR_PEP_ID=MMETSP0123-20130129/9756_1 /TAXON_ID=182087 /ORGANISM="Favella ehrenbergii, Strain Fehren 1" /LENGTH=124 /DNA_ID=CAMNT_0010731283 /DNA_START=563 /DNA_END=937 /DNA_ORIENTATION=+
MRRLRAANFGPADLGVIGTCEVDFGEDIHLRYLLLIEIFEVHVHQGGVRHEVVNDELSREHDCLETRRHITRIVPREIDPTVSLDETDENDTQEESHDEGDFSDHQLLHLRVQLVSKGAANDGD